MSDTTLIQRLMDEARLFDIEGASDISILLTAAADALEQQAAQIEALKADAERYRWLKLMKAGRNPEFTGYWMFWSMPTLKGETLDAAIDAALRQEQPT